MDTSPRNDVSGTSERAPRGARAPRRTTPPGSHTRASITRCPITRCLTPSEDTFGTDTFGTAARLERGRR